MNIIEYRSLQIRTYNSSSVSGILIKKKSNIISFLIGSMLVNFCYLGTS